MTGTDLDDGLSDLYLAPSVAAAAAEEMLVVLVA